MEMLTEIFAWLRNWFPRSQLLGTFVIENGNLRLTYDDGATFSNVPLVDGQYFRIINTANGNAHCQFNLVPGESTPEGFTLIRNDRGNKTQHFAKVKTN